MGLWHRVLLGNVPGDFLKENLTNWTICLLLMLGASL